jgi:hypothetical protein
MESTPRILRYAGRALLLATTLLAVCSAAPARDIFPYRVVTVADETPVACGPGEAFYATDLLPVGTPLEVYRRDANGWLAIRPPARSFSWIPARKLHISADERVATVIADDAVAWVGSHVETVSDHRWQVRLDRGERLAILGHRQLVDDKRGTTETWYQVEPPAGEYRWVHSGDVSRHAAKTTEATEATEPTVGNSRGAYAPFEPDNRLDAATRSGPAARGDAAARGGPATQVEPAQYRADPLRGAGANSRNELPARNEPPARDWSPRSRARSAADERIVDAGPGPNGIRGDRSGGFVADTAPLPVAGPAITMELEELTLQLNAIAQREPNLWNLGPLRARAESLIDSGSNALERGKARLMLEKIEEFEQLQQRHIRAERGLPPESPPVARESVPANPTARSNPLARSNPPTGFDFVSAGLGRASNSVADLTGGATVGDANTSGLNAGGPNAGALNAGALNPVGFNSAGSNTGGAAPRLEPRFDGTGWLLPVHSTKRVAPPYALLDDNGKVLQYVTPAPGLNLHRYERRRVGLYGQRTPTPSLNAPHLTAHRLVDLERHARKP